MDKVIDKRPKERNVVATGQNFITEIRLDSLREMRADNSGLCSHELSKSGCSGYVRTVLRNTAGTEEGDNVYYSAISGETTSRRVGDLVIETNVLSPIIRGPN